MTRLRPQDTSPDFCDKPRRKENYRDRFQQVLENGPSFFIARGVPVRPFVRDPGGCARKNQEAERKFIQNWNFEHLLSKAFTKDKLSGT
eukprot:9680436-Alexandrium_andersonii.AAC.1